MSRRRLLIKFTLHVGLYTCSEELIYIFEESFEVEG